MRLNPPTPAHGNSVNFRSIKCISVVIPVYNRVDELRRALQSLADQTVNNFEVLVCDDGSDEDIESVVTAFMPQLDIRYFRLEHSGGPALARKHGVNMASSKWISFLDSDDWWFPNRIEVITNLLSDKVDFLYHPLKIAYGSNRPKLFWAKSVGRAIEGDPFLDMMSRGNPIPNSSAVLRKELFNPVCLICEDKALASFEDFDAWLSAAQKGARFLYINRPLGYYWVGADNISVISKKQASRQELLFSRHCDALPAEFADWAKSYNNYTIGTYLLYTGQTQKALEALRKAKSLRFRSQRFKRFIKMVIAVIKFIFKKHC